MRQRAERINRRLMTLAVVIALVGTAIYISGMFGVIGKNRQIAALRSQIAVEESRRQQLDIALSGRENLEMVASEAVNRLGMVKPGSWSVRVITLNGDTTAPGTQTVLGAADEP